LEDGTFKEILGYPDNTNLDKPTNISPFMCEVYTVDKIFVHCDIAQGSWYNGKKSDIIYSFSSDVQYGAMIVINMKNIREYRLVNKWFNDMTFKFTDDKGRPINFEKSNVSLTLKIAQI
jgi:hypothetical protein